jgi:hypothetical protein
MPEVGAPCPKRAGIAEESPRADVLRPLATDAFKTSIGSPSNPKPYRFGGGKKSSEDDTPPKLEELAGTELM